MHVAIQNRLHVLDFVMSLSFYTYNAIETAMAVRRAGVQHVGNIRVSFVLNVHILYLAMFLDKRRQEEAQAC